MFAGVNFKMSIYKHNEWGLGKNKVYCPQSSGRTCWRQTAFPSTSPWLTVSKIMTSKKSSAVCGSIVQRYACWAGQGLLPAEEHDLPYGHPWCTVGVLEQRQMHFAWEWKANLGVCQACPGSYDTIVKHCEICFNEFLSLKPVCLSFHRMEEIIEFMFFTSLVS